MQQSRRSNPYPYTWEIPLAAVLGVVLLLFLGVHLGRAVANVWAGAGMTVPPSQNLVTSWPAVLNGDAGAGLAPRPESVATSGALRFWIVVVEALFLAGLLWLGWTAWVQWGPGAIRGVATREEVEKVVGRRRLQKQAHVIRPDLYTKKTGVIRTPDRLLKGHKR